MLGTAGTVICAVTTARRYNRRATASRSTDGLNGLTAGSSIRLFYTTRPSFHQQPDRDRPTASAITQHMSDAGPLITHVSDTARWTALYWATESARADPLFRDPLAERLAGQQGRAIVASAPVSSRNGGW